MNHVKTIVTTHTSGSNFPVQITLEQRAHHYLDMLTTGPEQLATVNFCLDASEEALQEWLDVANCGRRRSLPFEEFFPDYSLMSYRDALGQPLPGYTRVAGADGHLQWVLLSPESLLITVDERADYVREYLQPRFLAWLADAFSTFVFGEKRRLEQEDAETSDHVYDLMSGRFGATGTEDSEPSRQTFPSQERRATSHRIGRNGRPLHLYPGEDYVAVVTRYSDR